jgi:hypothetical protein
VLVGSLAALLLGSGCSDETPQGLRDRPDVSMEDLSEALGCDAMRGTPYDVGPFLGNAGPPFTSVEVERDATAIEMDGFLAGCTFSCALSTRAK